MNTNEMLLGMACIGVLTSLFFIGRACFEKSEEHPEWTCWDKMMQPVYRFHLLFLCISFVALSLYAVMVYIWWPQHQAAMDAKVARLMDYHLVWYDPYRPLTNLGLYFLFPLSSIALIGIGIWRLIYKTGIKDTLYYLVFGLFVGGLSIWLISESIDGQLNAVYFGKDHIVELYGPDEDYAIFDRASMSYEYEERVDHGGKSTEYYKSYTLHYEPNGSWFRIDIETNEDFELERFPIGTVKSDREAIIKEIKTLKPYRK